MYHSEKSKAHLFMQPLHAFNPTFLSSIDLNPFALHYLNVHSLVQQFLEHIFAARAAHVDYISTLPLRRHSGAVFRFGSIAYLSLGYLLQQLLNELRF